MRSSRRPGQDSSSGIVNGCGPKSPGSHRAVWGLIARPPDSPAGFPAVSRLPAGFFPFVRLPLVSLRPAFSGSFPSAVARFRFPPRFPSGFPFPWAIFTLALPRGGSAGVGPGRQGPRSPALPRPPPLDRAIRPHSRWRRLGTMGCRHRIACYERPPSTGHRRARTAQADILPGRPRLRLLSVTDFPSASVPGWQRSRLPTTWAWPRSLAVPMVPGPVRGMTARWVWTGWRLARNLILHNWGCAGRDSLMSPGQLSIARVTSARRGLGAAIGLQRGGQRRNEA